MHNRNAAVLVGFALTALVACQSGPAPLTEADREGLATLGEDFSAAMKAGDADALAALYTEDAILLPPGSPAVRGRDAIRDYMATFPPIAELSVTEEGFEGIGDTVYAYGFFEMTLDLPGSPTDRGKYLDIRKRQPHLRHVSQCRRNTPAGPAGPNRSAV